MQSEFPDVEDISIRLRNKYLKQLLDDNKVLYARLDEPMSCDEVVLQKYLPERKEA